jgi:uncharacterized protein
MAQMPQPMVEAALIGASLLALFVAYSVAENRLTRTVRDQITFPDLPAELDGLRIVFLTDVHAGPFFGERRMASLVGCVNALEPDVIVLGGDNVGGSAHGARVFYPAARQFKAARAKVAVLGNHDIWEGADEARTGLRNAGFIVLENDNVKIEAESGGAVWIAGVEDLYTGRPDVAQAARGIDPSAFSILVSHNPDVFATQLGATAPTWNLALAGHTHGGQITFFGLWSAVVPSEYGQRYRSGWLDQDGVRILVSNGVGAVTVPMRVFARPEIHLITLRQV